MKSLINSATRTPNSPPDLHHRPTPELSAMDAAFTSSQRRSVFVGNIPYDASEDQLVQICEEVGPVVSFRLMVDKETRRPKGYGFCEYKDEETALSARRNLQGYELNGRQLRVNFAQNDKGSDLGREQDRGGPGLISNNSNDDAQKPLPGPPVPGDSSLHQPMGLPLASSAASVMEKALGGSILQNLSGLGNDPLTIYLSKISRRQLNDIMNEMKVLATQNKPLVRQLLQGSPQFSKALFQAQIMMGLVSQQMLQMAYERLSSNSVPQPSLKDNTADQKTLPSYPGQIALQKEAVVPNLLPNSIPLEKSAPPFQHVPVQSPLQHLFPLQCHGHPQGMMPGQSGVPTLQPQTLLVAPTSLMPRIHPLVLPHPKPSNVNTGHHPHLSGPSTILQQSLLSHPPTSQMCSTSHSVQNGLEAFTKSAESSNYVGQNLTGLSRLGKHPNGLVEQRGFTDLPELINNPSKRQRLENGASAQVTSNNPVSGKSIAAGSLSANHQTIANPVKQLEKLMPQLPLDVESGLLQQVLCLTREQLSSLPLDHQQQVFQLQQTIR